MINMLDISLAAHFALLFCLCGCNTASISESTRPSPWTPCSVPPVRVQNMTWALKCICLVALWLMPIFSIHFDFIICTYCMSFCFLQKPLPEGQRGEGQHAGADVSSCCRVIMRIMKSKHKGALFLPHSLWTRQRRENTFITTEVEREAFS